MADLEIYSKALSTYNGKIISNNSSVKVQWESGMNPVDTIGNGFSGMSQGSPKCQIALEVFVPAAGLEIDPIPDMEAMNVIDFGVQIPGSGLQMICKCFVTAADFNYSVNDAGKMNISLTGKFERFE